MKKTALALGIVFSSLILLQTKTVHADTIDSSKTQAALKANKTNTEEKLTVARNHNKASLKAEILNLSTHIKEEKKKAIKHAVQKSNKISKPKNDTATQKPKVVVQKPIIQTQTQITQPVSNNQPKKIHQYPKSVNDYGLDMNQTTGTVNIGALAHYLAAVKGTFSADEWAKVITRESGGSLTATNPSSGAYGVLQLLGHGEHAGMTLGEQLQMAMPLPASAWAETAY